MWHTQASSKILHAMHVLNPDFRRVTFSETGYVKGVVDTIVPI